MTDPKDMTLEEVREELEEEKKKEETPPTLGISVKDTVRPQDIFGRR